MRWAEPLMEVTNHKSHPIWSELLGGLWHTTSRMRFQSILRCGAILPEPDIQEKDRWGTSQGPGYDPYVRTLNGESLFDFNDFDAEAYSRTYPMSGWEQFVPY